ncbi:unnamed protein product, partial [Rotaria sordida]
MLLRRIICYNSPYKNLLQRHASSTTSLINISTSDNEQICRIQLNNPRQRNILSLAMINDLIKAIEDN